MAHRKHFAVEKLSPKAQVIVHRALGERWTDARTVAAVKAETGESLAPSSLARYASRWQAQNDETRAAQDQAKAIIAEIAANNITAADAARALLTQSLLENRAAFKILNPLAVAREERERQKLDLDREKTALDRDKHEFDKRKFDAMERQKQEIAEKARQAKERVALNPEEGARLIDELYGLTQK